MFSIGFVSLSADALRRIVSPSAASDRHGGGTRGERRLALAALLCVVGLALAAALS